MLPLNLSVLMLLFVLLGLFCLFLLRFLALPLRLGPHPCSWALPAAPLDALHLALVWHLLHAITVVLMAMDGSNATNCLEKCRLLALSPPPLVVARHFPVLQGDPSPFFLVGVALAVGALDLLTLWVALSLLMICLVLWALLLGSRLLIHLRACRRIF